MSLPAGPPSHSFATNLLSRGVPREVVQLLLGHADRRTTERYANLADAAVLRALRTSPETSPESE